MYIMRFLFIFTSLGVRGWIGCIIFLYAIRQMGFIKLMFIQFLHTNVRICFFESHAVAATGVSPELATLSRCDQNENPNNLGALRWLSGKKLTVKVSYFAMNFEYSELDECTQSRWKYHHSPLCPTRYPCCPS